MANKTAPLTDTQIRQAKPKTKEYNLADGGGLACRVKPSGSKLWLFNYSRPHTKKRSNMGLGQYPDVTLAIARREAEKYRTLLAQGIDPKEQRDKEAQEKLVEAELTLQSVIDNWFKIKKTSISAGYADNIIQSLNNHITPTLGKRPLSHITAKLVISTLGPLAGSGKLEAVKRISQRLNEVFIYAVNTGLIQHNPIAGIRHAFEKPVATNNPTLKPEELPELMATLSKASIRTVTHLLIKWQLHTMTRPSEAAGAQWSEIDRAESLWRIPAGRMKKRREHIIPLSAQALAILDDIHAISGSSEYIFPSDINPKKCANSATANMALKRMGFGGRLTAHGMRSIASTTLNEQGFDSDVIEAALAHVDKNSVRGAYNHAQYIERRRALMAWWSSHIEQAAKGNLSTANTGNVLSITAKN